METEYIEKSAVLDRINQELRCGATADQCGLETAYDLLHNIQPADVRPVVRGEWIPPRYPYPWYRATCSICGYEDPASYGGSGWKWKDKKWIPLNYCPSCGADMRGGDAE